MEEESQRDIIRSTSIHISRTRVVREDRQDKSTQGRAGMPMRGVGRLVGEAEVLLSILGEDGEEGKEEGEERSVGE